MSKRTSARVVAVFLAALSSSCASPRRGQDAQREDIIGGGHWLQDARLRELMVDLDRQVTVSWPQEIEEEYLSTTSASTARQLEEACWLADALATAADKIPAAIEGSHLSDARHQEFLHHVDELRFKAERLEKAAEQADVDALRRVLNSIDHTCKDCHNRFRAVAGPLR